MVDGLHYAAPYKQPFDDKEDAEEFVRGLEGRTIPVHYNPGKPEEWCVFQEDVFALQNSRPTPAICPNAAAPPVALTTSPFTRLLLYPVLALAVIGLVASVTAHLAAYAGRLILPAEGFSVLGLGIFEVCGAMILILNWLNRDVQWKHALKRAWLTAQTG